MLERIEHWPRARPPATGSTTGHGLSYWPRLGHWPRARSLSMGSATTTEHMLKRILARYSTCFLRIFAPWCSHETS